jgi:RimJ/RimL family protein N-acetyltransferase
MPNVIATDRLILRTWKTSDVEEMAAINDDAAVMRFFPNRPSREDTIAHMERQNLQFAKRAHCYFAAERREDGRLLGFIGLSHQTYPAPFTPCVDIGWRLHPDAWGRGFATEGALACLEYARDGLELTEILAVAPQVNGPSIAVMRRIGMLELGTFYHPNIPEESPLNPCVWWGISW